MTLSETVTIFGFWRDIELPSLVLSLLWAVSRRCEVSENVQSGMTFLLGALSICELGEACEKCPYRPDCGRTRQKNNA